MNKKFFLIGKNLQSSVCLNGALNRETIENELLKSGWDTTDNYKEADAIIGSFCVMTYTEIQEAVRLIIKYSSFPAKLYVCGCITKAKDIIIPLRARLNFTTFSTSQELVSELTNTPIHIKPDFDIFNNQFVINISEGCNKRCTFCKTSYIDATYKSKSIDSIINAIKTGVSLGFNSIVFNAMNSTQYGCDLETQTTLNDLLVKCLEIPNVLYQLNGLVASELTPELISTLTNPRFIVIQLEAQSFIPTVRKNMKIGDDNAKVLKTALRAFKNKVIFSNVMVGYPGESSKKFDEQLNLIKRENYWFLTVNALEATPGTPVMYMDRPEEASLNNRVRKVTKVIYDLRVAKANSLLNKKVKVLIVANLNSVLVGIYQGIYVYVHDFDDSVDIGDEHEVVLRSVTSYFNIQQQMEMSDQFKEKSTDTEEFFKNSDLSWLKAFPKSFQDNAKKIISSGSSMDDPIRVLIGLTDLLAKFNTQTQREKTTKLMSSVPDYLNLKDYMDNMLK
mgnify:FL=1